MCSLITILVCIIVLSEVSERIWVRNVTIRCAKCACIWLQFFLKYVIPNHIIDIGKSSLTSDLIYWTSRQWSDRAISLVHSDVHIMQHTWSNLNVQNRFILFAETFQEVFLKITSWLDYSFVFRYAIYSYGHF